MGILEKNGTFFIVSFVTFCFTPQKKVEPPLFKVIIVLV